MRDHRRETTFRARVPRWIFKVVTLAGAILASFQVTGAALAAPSAASDVKIATLDCAASPEVIEISNAGPDAEDLAGWKLVSDPLASQSYDLSALGTLPPGSSIFVEAGPAAAATFTWSNSEVFRDGDPSDFARLANDAGQAVSQVACAATQGATIAPTATASAAPLGDIPDGGGPPGDAAKFIVRPLVAVVAGAALLAVGFVAFTAALIGTASPRLRLGASRSTILSPMPLPPPTRMPFPVSRRPRRGSEPVLLALTAAILAAVIVALFNQRQSGRSGN